MTRSPTQILAHAATVATTLLWALGANPADLVLDNFEAEPERWGAGTTLSTDHVKQGHYSMRWQADRHGRVTRTDFPSDWSDYRALGFWIYSERATGNQLIVTFESDDPATEGGDYFVLYSRIDWSGWRQFELTLDELGRARSPMGLHAIGNVNFYTVGWGQKTPVPGTVLHLDDLHLRAKTDEELAKAREMARRRRFGFVTPLPGSEDLLENLARGADGLVNWETLPLDHTAQGEFGVRQDWHGATLWAKGNARSRCGRDYDVDTTPHQAMFIGVSVGRGTDLIAEVTVDGETVTAHAGTGQKQLLVPLTGGRLERLELEVVGPDTRGERAATLKWIKLRKHERPAPEAFSSTSRGVMLAWSRPAWGAAEYRLFRSRTPVLALGQTPVRDALPATLRATCDFPPATGTWHYALAPLAGQGPGSLGSDVKVAVGGETAPVITRSSGPVTVDGDLRDWGPDTAQLLIGGAADLAAGQPPRSDEDLSGSVRLCHDDTMLYVAAEVTDDVVRHSSTRPWEGDGLVIMVRFRPPKPNETGQRYDLVLNYTSRGDGPPIGAILEDRVVVHSADAKPPAPGQWAAATGATGYSLEVAVPLTALVTYGFDPRIGGLLLGLSIYDGDETTGPTTRETALSWNQRANLYDPREAVVVRWE